MITYVFGEKKDELVKILKGKSHCKDAFELRDFAGWTSNLVFKPYETIYVIWVGKWVQFLITRHKIKIYMGKHVKFMDCQSYNHIDFQLLQTP